MTNRDYQSRCRDFTHWNCKLTHLCFCFFTAESDLVTFIQIKNHYKTDYAIFTNLFTVETRTDTLRKMYENAAKTPVTAIAEMDEILGNRERRSSDAFICTPILGQIRRRMKNSIDIEIETRMVKINIEIKSLVIILMFRITTATQCLWKLRGLKLIKDSSVLIK